MSDLLYNEVPGYKTGDWKDYAVHDEKNVKGFFGDYRFLSNFHEEPVIVGGELYRSAENAYQAQKVNPEFQKLYRNITPMAAKKLNREHLKDKKIMAFSGDTWDKVKIEVMAEIVFLKFSITGFESRVLLLETGDRYLEETNHWKDTFWGVDYKTGNGFNALGTILMKVRRFWK